MPSRSLKWDNKQTHRRQPAENLSIFSSKVPFECWLGVRFRENDKETIKLSIFEGEKKDTAAGFEPLPWSVLDSTGVQNV